MSLFVVAYVVQQRGHGDVLFVDALPRASGGKVAKQALREDIRRRLG